MFGVGQPGGGSEVINRMKAKKKKARKKPRNPGDDYGEEFPY